MVRHKLLQQYADKGVMRAKISELITHEWGHPNLTLHKAFRFGVGYGLMYPVGLLLLWLLTEKAGIWYIYSSLISGGCIAIARFVIGAVFAFPVVATKESE